MEVFFYGIGPAAFAARHRSVAARRASEGDWHGRACPRNPLAGASGCDHPAPETERPARLDGAASIRSAKSVVHADAFDSPAVFKLVGQPCPPRSVSRRRASLCLSQGARVMLRYLSAGLAVALLASVGAALAADDAKKTEEVFKKTENGTPEIKSIEAIAFGPNGAMFLG